MLGDIRTLLAEVPFLPFIIHMADGREVRVPSRDHISIGTARVTVTRDDGSKNILPGLLMAGLTVDRPPE